MSNSYYISHDDENISSVIGLEIAFVDEISFININKSERTFGAIEFNPGCDFLNIYVTPGKSKADTKQKNKNGNIYYDSSIDAYHPKDRADATEKLFEMVKHKVIAKYKTGNGYTKLLGTLEEPAELMVDISEPASGGYNGYKIKLSGNFTLPPLYEA